MWECATLAAKIHSKPSAGYNKATAKVKAGGGGFQQTRRAQRTQRMQEST